MDRSIKVVLKTSSNMGGGKKCFPIEIDTKESTFRVCLMVQGCTFGETEPHTKAILFRGIDRVKEF
jgi:hypothetical protein